jgi:hypothetical protein
MSVKKPTHPSTINIFLLKGIGMKNKCNVNDVADVYGIKIAVQSSTTSFT